jgi:hypothetical protein
MTTHAERVGTTVGMILLSPILGLLYVVFLPFIGFAVVGYVLVKKTLEKLAKISSFSWQPIESYLTGKNNRKEK